jgi:hypothetical protein
MLECLASCSPVGEEFEEAIIIADGVIEEMDGSDEFRTPTIRSQIAKRKPLTGAKMGALVQRAHAVVCAQVLDIVERTRDF